MKVSLLLFVTSAYASFYVDFTFSVHKDCNVAGDVPGEHTVFKDVIVLDNCNDPSYPTLGCVNEEKGTGSSFKGCYDSVFEIPLAGEVKLSHQGCSNCSCSATKAVITPSGLCVSDPSGKNISQVSYCTSRDNREYEQFIKSNACEGTPSLKTTFTANKCEKLSDTMSTSTYCVGDLGRTPKPPPKDGSPSQTSSSTRLMPFLINDFFNLF